MAEIRLLTVEDYDRVIALWRSVPGMGLNTTDDGPAGFARFLARNPDTCFYAVEDGQLIGTILAGDDGRRGFLHHAAVLPQRQGQGIGRRLVEAALEALRKNGVQKVGLVAFRSNQAGSRFWDKMGFDDRQDVGYHSKIIGEIQSFPPGK